jgi:hypothetical protein
MASILDLAASGGRCLAGGNLLGEPGRVARSVHAHRQL